MAHEILASQEKKSKSYSKEEALALVLEADLSRDKYNIIRTTAQQKDSKLYVSWYAVCNFEIITFVCCL